MSEVWFNHGENTLMVLTSGDRCFVVFTTSPEDNGLIAKHHEADTSNDRFVSFILENGQEDYWLLSETIEASVAIKVIQFFVECGKPYPLVKWAK